MPPTCSAAAGDAPVSFVLTQAADAAHRPVALRPRADDACATSTLPAARTFEPAVTVRLDQRASDAVLARLLGIDGPAGVEPPRPARRRPPAGRRPTATRRRHGRRRSRAPIGATLDLVDDRRPVDRVHRSPNSAATTRRSTALRLTTPGHGRRRRRRRRPTPAARAPSRSRRRAGRPGAGRDHGRSTRTSRSTGATPSRWCCRRRSARSRSVPAPPLPAQLDTGCRDDLAHRRRCPVPDPGRGDVADLLAGAAVTATAVRRTARPRPPAPIACAPPPAPPPGSTSTASSSPARTPRRRRPGRPRRPTVTVRASERTSRHVTVSTGARRAAGSCSARATTRPGRPPRQRAASGPPQLVDGGFNGWWIPPSAGPVDVAIHWTVQGPLTLALILSGIGVAACLALIALDRRRAGRHGAAATAVRRRRAACAVAGALDRHRHVGRRRRAPGRVRLGAARRRRRRGPRPVARTAAPGRLASRSASSP